LDFFFDETDTIKVKTALIYDTGIWSPFEYHTLRVELTLNSYDVPLMIWFSRGYNSDVAQYYKLVNSMGVTFEFRTF
jgi:hypothetical protein